MIDINHFIKSSITNRTKSLFSDDIEKYTASLTEAIKGRSLMVIGGAGTIGSSYIKALLKFNPSKLYVVDTNENGLTELTRDLRSNPETTVPDVYRTYPMNFSDDVFEKMFRAEGPFDIVANFAAHKHVRSEKDRYSIEAMLENNVFRAKKLLDLLLELPPKYFFCVSTDKATNPVNVMGASKKLMEEVIMSYADKIPITTARFANVAFSNGSLLYGYLERIMKKQTITCPSDVKRFFVSPEESGQICMLACILGETGDIFFPKLEEKQMINFKEITESFIKELGYEVDLCANEEQARSKSLTITKDTIKYPVYYFKTDTSGEKLFEEFYADNDIVDLNSFNSLGVIKNSVKKNISDVETMLDRLRQSLKKESYTKEDIVNMISEFIPDFHHIETGKSLDDKM